ncbi:MAG: ABC transporter ATP-binding protein [Cyanobacteria bacterium P01_H01_bin.15]
MSQPIQRTLINTLQQVFQLKEALHLVWRSSPRWTTIRLLLLITQEILPLIRIYLSKLLLDVIAEGFNATDKQVILQRFFVLLVGMVLLEGCGTLLGSLNRIIRTTHQLLVTDYVNNRIHQQAIALDLEYYESSGYYDILSRAREQAPTRCNSIVERLFALVRHLISVTAMLGILLVFDWRIPVLVSLSVLPRLLIRFKEIQKLYQWDRYRTSLQRKADYYSEVITKDIYIKEARLFGLGGFFQNRYATLRQQLREEEIRISWNWVRLDIFTQFISVLVFQGTYALIAYRAIMGRITLGDLIMYYQFFQRGYNSVWQIFGSLSGLYEDNLFLVNYHDFLALTPKIISPSDPTPLVMPMRQGIQFDHVTFQYPNSQRTAIKDVSLAIQPGQVIALVGENGSGKTTLVKLLCRLYDPSHGRITADRVDLRALDLKQWRDQISVVFQDYVKYQLTARENIWLGKIDADPEHPQLTNAAVQSGIDEVIAKLPQGYDTVLGKQFAGGEELSIGQWQKLVIARAFWRDAPLIILDEPTSALDPRSEYEVFQQFRRLLQGQSAVLISHRLSTVKMADYIYVLEQGAVIEQGTHQQLMALQGRYQEMFDTQAANYR